MGERLVVQDHVDEDKWPYLFCANCGRLSPVKYDKITQTPECLVCHFALILSQSGRTVYLSKNEAKVRGLPTVKIKDRGD
jgi:hypothetical protein